MEPNTIPSFAKCPRCGAPLVDPGSRTEDCPRCLLGIALQPDPDRTAEAALPDLATLAALFPDYEIQCLLGRGGMGAVYRAVHRKLGRPIAIKLLLPGLVADPAFAERLEREARTLAGLDHPGIVGVHDFGAAGGFHYLALHFVEGTNLRRIMDGRQLTRSQIADFAVQICDALQYAHDHGIVHRDIKPENLLVDREGHVRITDFGIAKIVGAGAEAALTRTHEAIGTPHYMAPEQVTGSSTVDHRADLYSVGVVLYEMLTGELPIGRFRPPSYRAPAALPLDAVVMKALENEPGRRFASAREFRDALAAKPAPRTVHDSEPRPLSDDHRAARTSLTQALIAVSTLCMPWVTTGGSPGASGSPSAGGGSGWPVNGGGFNPLDFAPESTHYCWNITLVLGIGIWIVPLSQVLLAVARPWGWLLNRSTELLLAWVSFALSAWLVLSIAMTDRAHFAIGTVLTIVLTSFTLLRVLRSGHSNTRR